MADRILQKLTLSPGMLPAGISQAQSLALASLLAGRTVTAAAEAAGVSRQTVHKWLSDDAEFVAFYGQARREMFDALQQGLMVLSGSALRSLRILLARRRAKDSVKLAAALGVLKLIKQIDGPVDAEEAQTAIATRERKRKLARLMSGRRADDEPVHRAGPSQSVPEDEDLADGEDLDEPDAGDDLEQK